jgi:DNA-binding NarL/FixJ family response regulator
MSQDHAGTLERTDARQLFAVCGKANLARTVVDVLRPRGMQRTEDDGAETAVVVCGWPGEGLTEQRHRARETVERVAPRGTVLITDLVGRGALERLVAEGVNGIVLEDELEITLAPTVRAVASGQLCVPERVRAAIEHRPLSLREREILALVIMGLSNGEIAGRLHLAESTVKSHLVSTFAKLGVRSRAEAAVVVSDPQQMLSTGVLGLSGDARHD